MQLNDNFIRHITESLRRLDRQHPKGTVARATLDRVFYPSSLRATLNELDDAIGPSKIKEEPVYAIPAPNDAATPYIPRPIRRSARLEYRGLNTDRLVEVRPMPMEVAEDALPQAPARDTEPF